MTSALQRAARVALADRLRELLPRSPRPLLDDRGGVREFRDNLLPHLTAADADWIREAFAQGDGDELAPRPGTRSKAQMAHSSATLAANTFAPFRERPRDLMIAGLHGFDAVRLETKHHPLPERLGRVAAAGDAHPGGGASGETRFGDEPADDGRPDPAAVQVGNRRPANLDAEPTGPGIVVGVESKLTEHLAPHVPASWRWEYRQTATLAPLDEPWRDAILRRIDGPSRPTCLGAMQLLKHALALSRAAQDGAFGPDPVDLHLVYLFWEPSNADAHEEVAWHREEVDTFAAEVAGGGPTFHALTHRQLWDAWQTSGAAPGWRAAHARALAERYDVAVAS